MALISVNLGVINVLPIPVLDGGHLLFFLVEAIRRRPISIRSREVAIQVGVVVLGALMVFVFFNDIVRILNDFAGAGKG
jgi:regulator of sigma E protease